MTLVFLFHTPPGILVLESKMGLTITLCLVNGCRANIDAGLFVEHAEVHGNLYGTSIAAVQEVTKKGRVCLLEH